MLNRETAAMALHEGERLLSLRETAIGRKLRRFVARHLSNSGELFQTFAHGEDFTVKQLESLGKYANLLATNLQSMQLEGLCVNFGGTLVDTDMGYVFNQYKFSSPVQTASVKDLKEMTKVIVLLAEALQNYAEVAENLLKPMGASYVYRNYPGDLGNADELWCVSGTDVAASYEGMLEWCLDEEDTSLVLAQMNRFPEQFKNLRAERWHDVLKREEAAEATQ